LVFFLVCYKGFCNGNYNYMGIYWIWWYVISKVFVVLDGFFFVKQGSNGIVMYYQVNRCSIDVL
jgi:hypothetical protein